MNGRENFILAHLQSIWWISEFLISPCSFLSNRIRRSVLFSFIVFVKQIKQIFRLSPIVSLFHKAFFGFHMNTYHIVLSLAFDSSLTSSSHFDLLFINSALTFYRFGMFFFSFLKPFTPHTGNKLGKVAPWKKLFFELPHWIRVNCRSLGSRWERHVMLVVRHYH